VEAASGTFADRLMLWFLHLQCVRTCVHRDVGPPRVTCLSGHCSGMSAVGG
jgi:hypothetical protein